MNAQEKLSTARTPVQEIFLGPNQDLYWTTTGTGDLFAEVCNHHEKMVTSCTN
jgi:hypothetical protein